jgi:hypothetical protein
MDTGGAAAPAGEPAGAPAKAPAGAGKAALAVVRGVRLVDGDVRMCAVAGVKAWQLACCLVGVGWTIAGWVGWRVGVLQTGAQGVAKRAARQHPAFMCVSFHQSFLAEYCGRARAGNGQGEERMARRLQLAEV